MAKKYEKCQKMPKKYLKCPRNAKNKRISKLTWKTLKSTKEHQK